MLNQSNVDLGWADAGHALLPTAVGAPRENSAHIGVLAAFDTSFDNSTALGPRPWGRL